MINVIRLGKALSDLERARDKLGTTDLHRGSATHEFEEFDENEPVRIAKLTDKKRADE